MFYILFLGKCRTIEKIVVVPKMFLILNRTRKIKRKLDLKRTEVAAPHMITDILQIRKSNSTSNGHVQARPTLKKPR